MNCFKILFQLKAALIRLQNGLVWLDFGSWGKGAQKVPMGAHDLHTGWWYPAVFCRNFVDEADDDEEWPFMCPKLALLGTVAWGAHPSRFIWQKPSWTSRAEECFQMIADGRESGQMIADGRESWEILDDSIYNFDSEEENDAEYIDDIKETGSTNTESLYTALPLAPPGMKWTLTPTPARTSAIEVIDHVSLRASTSSAWLEEDC